MTSQSACETNVDSRSFTVITRPQFKVALRYPRDLVFQVVSAEPKTWGWKVGPTGAFADQGRTSLPGGGAIVFRFYSGEFDG